MNKTAKKEEIYLRQKFFCVLFGLVLVFLIIESGLRFSGYLILSLQECRNLRAAREKGTCRILCLGESTTQNQWPVLLEEILNLSNVGIKFSVIDKGLAGVKTSWILARLESYLDQYNPDIVITMIGINDGRFDLPYGSVSPPKAWAFLESLRIFKLIKILKFRIIARIKSLNNRSFRADPAGIDRKMVLGTGSQSCGISGSATGKTTELDPVNSMSHMELGRLCWEQGKFPEAETAFKKAAELDPENIMPNMELGRLYWEQGKFPEAEALFRKAIKLDPKNNKLFIELGELYHNEGKFLMAENQLSKAIKLNPADYKGHLELGRLYRDYNAVLKAEISFKRAMTLNANDNQAYVELGLLYWKQGDLSSSAALFEEVVKVDPHDDRAFSTLATLYEKIGKPELARKNKEIADEMRLSNYNASTISNYRNIKRILDKRKIRLICVQYPLRKTKQLIKMFQGNNENIIFVDNERLFKDAIQKSSYKEYFKDMFAGDFGHCTIKGNRLLAENIASSILKEVFAK
jgi:Tfp pilus assembly protein PilF